MSQPKLSPLEKLTHDVNSKCDSLKEAVVLLRASSPKETAELLGLMRRQAEDLAQVLAGFERSQGK